MVVHNVFYLKVKVWKETFEASSDVTKWCNRSTTRKTWACRCWERVKPFLTISLLHAHILFWIHLNTYSLSHTLTSFLSLSHTHTNTHAHTHNECKKCYASLKYVNQGTFPHKKLRLSFFLANKVQKISWKQNLVNPRKKLKIEFGYIFRIKLSKSLR